MSAGIGTNPFLWTALAALCAGLATGQALGLLLGRAGALHGRAQRGRASAGSAGARPGAAAVGAAAVGDGRPGGSADGAAAVGSGRPGGGADGDAAFAAERQSGRLARAFVFASLAVLAFAVLLVLPPKASLAAPALCAWAAALGLAGLAAGLWPRAGTAAALALAAAAIVAIRMLAAPWSPYTEGEPLARLLPLSVDSGRDGASYRAEFRLLGPGAPMSPIFVELPTNEASLVVETLELRGPLAFIAIFPEGGSQTELKLFRIIGLGGSQAAPYLLPRRRAAGDLILEHLVPSGSGGGSAPGGPAFLASAVGSLVRFTRGTSTRPELRSFQPVVFEIGPGGAPEIAPPPGESLSPAR